MASEIGSLKHRISDLGCFTASTPPVVGPRWPHADDRMCERTRLRVALVMNQPSMASQMSLKTRMTLCLSICPSDVPFFGTLGERMHIQTQYVWL
jgi:hypothetical protein